MNPMRTISDEEKIAILERRHALIIHGLLEQIKHFEGLLKPQPSPMDFQMATAEEEQSVRDEIECHNSVIWVQLGTYKDILKMIQREDEKLLAQVYPQLHDLKTTL